MKITSYEDYLEEIFDFHFIVRNGQIDEKRGIERCTQLGIDQSTMKKDRIKETVNRESKSLGVSGAPMEDREVPRCDRNAFAASPVHQQSQCHKC